MMDKKRSLYGIVVAGDGDLFRTGEVIAPIGEQEETPEQETITISEMENIEARR